MPTEDAHAPMEMHHFGCGIWSQMRRSTGASLNGTRPAQMNTSAWRGEKLWRSMPNRAMSKRDAAVAMYSMAQHAVPNGIGHIELARDQLAGKSSRVVTQLGDIDETIVVSSSTLAVAGFVLVPCGSINPIRTLPA